jgi:hypothetical protein
MIKTINVYSQKKDSEYRTKYKFVRVTEGIGDKVNNAKAIDALILTFVIAKLDGTTQKQDRY